MSHIGAVFGLRQSKSLKTGYAMSINLKSHLSLCLKARLSMFDDRFLTNFYVRSSNCHYACAIICEGRGVSHYVR